MIRPSSPREQCEKEVERFRFLVCISVKRTYVIWFRIRPALQSQIPSPRIVVGKRIDLNIELNRSNKNMEITIPVLRRWNREKGISFRRYHERYLPHPQFNGEKESEPWRQTVCASGRLNNGKDGSLPVSEPVEICFAWLFLFPMNWLRFHFFTGNGFSPAGSFKWWSFVQQTLSLAITEKLMKRPLHDIDPLSSEGMLSHKYSRSTWADPDMSEFRMCSSHASSPLFSVIPGNKWPIYAALCDICCYYPSTLKPKRRPGSVGISAGWMQSSRK